MLKKSRGIEVSVIAEVKELTKELRKKLLSFPVKARDIDIFRRIYVFPSAPLYERIAVYLLERNL